HRHVAHRVGVDVPGDVLHTRIEVVAAVVVDDQGLISGARAHERHGDLRRQRARAGDAAGHLQGGGGAVLGVDGEADDLCRTGVVGIAQDHGREDVGDAAGERPDVGGVDPAVGEGLHAARAAGRVHAHRTGGQEACRHRLGGGVEDGGVGRPLDVRVDHHRVARRVDRRHRQVLAVVDGGGIGGDRVVARAVAAADAAVGTAAVGVHELEPVGVEGEGAAVVEARLVEHGQAGAVHPVVRLAGRGDGDPLFVEAGVRLVAAVPGVEGAAGGELVAVPALGGIAGLGD